MGKEGEEEQEGIGREEEVSLTVMRS